VEVEEAGQMVPGNRGVFLATSWRMEPSLTAMVSELFYNGRLMASCPPTMKLANGQGV